MKAVFTTPWKRTAAPGYVPAPVDPYKVAVVTTHLQALLAKATVTVHTLDLSPDVVVELTESGKTVDIPEDTHRAIQAVVDTLVDGHELCVFVPVEGVGLPPVDYQTRMLPYIQAGPETAWHMLLGTDQPALFADLRGAADFTIEAETIHDAVVAALTHQYVKEQGQGPVPPTPVVLRADQDVAEAVATLKMHLFAYPDTVDGAYLSDRVEWMWRVSAEPYDGPLRAGVDAGAKAFLAALPDGAVPIGVGADVGAKVQKALGEVLELKSWRDVILVMGPQASVCVLLARSSP